MKTTTHDKNFHFLLSIGFYLLLGMFFIKYYQYQINNDGISYITIAQKYMHGDFVHAINGYWGPLISWLIVPFLFLKINPLAAVKILSLFIGVFCLWSVKSFTYNFKFNDSIRFILLFTVIPIILFFAFSVITPDLLLTGFLIYYLNIIFSENYAKYRNYGIVCGIMGSFAYLSKAYALPFFIASFILFNCFHYFKNQLKERRKNILLNFLWGFVTFSIISGVWITLLSYKYNEITYGTAGKFIHACLGPNSSWEIETPISYAGLIEPPNETAICAVEDHYYHYSKTMPWNPFESWFSFKHQLKLILRNVHGIFQIYKSFSVFSFVILIGYILLIVPPSKNKLLNVELLFPLLTIVLYQAGYTMVLVDTRYLILVNILILLMGGYILSLLFQYEFFNKTRKQIVLFFFILSFIAMPIKCLIKDINIGKDIYELSNTLKYSYNMHGRIASNKEYHKSVYLSYYLKAKYLGMSKRNLNVEELQSELKKFKIEFYFVWDEFNKDYKFLSDFEEITHGKIAGLRVYSLKSFKQ